MAETDTLTEALQRLVDAKPDTVFTAAFDTIRKGAPGLSESSCAALARSIAIEVAYGPYGKSHKAMLEALNVCVAWMVDLANSGDAGFWDPEKTPEVSQARAAIASALGEG